MIYFISMQRLSNFSIYHGPLLCPPGVKLGVFLENTKTGGVPKLVLLEEGGLQITIFFKALDITIIIICLVVAVVVRFCYQGSHPADLSSLVTFYNPGSHPADLSSLVTSFYLSQDYSQSLCVNVLNTYLTHKRASRMLKKTRKISVRGQKIQKPKRACRAFTRHSHCYNNVSQHNPDHWAKIFSHNSFTPLHH